MATFTGTQANDTLIGGDGDDTLIGLGGDDFLDGGLGNDRHEGGDGNDTYVVRQAGDTIIENAIENQPGTIGDQVIVDVTSLAFSQGAVAATFFAPVNIEAVSAADQSGTQRFDLVGSTTTRTLVGNNGVNNISSGGRQAQTLIGLGGDDTYTVSASAAVVQEAANGGNDTLNVIFQAAVVGPPAVPAFDTYNLTAGQSIETINLFNAGSITGNELAQTINGSNSADTIDGGGGNDLLNGFDGDDVIAVDQGDRVFGGNGIDRVIASSAYALTGATPTSVFNLVEFLELAGRDTAATTVLEVNAAETTNFLVGDQNAQTIIGDNGANTLLGAPTATGSGLDTLIGLGGSDIYRVYNQNNIVVEGSTDADADTGGFDTIYTSVTYDLSANDAAALAAAGTLGITDAAAVQEIEVLSTADNAATTAINLTGNSYAQNVIGNNGANQLNGGGGEDLLIGLGGNDTYIVGNAGVGIQEAANGGTDTVFVNFTTGAGAFTNFVLSADAQVEQIVNNTVNPGRIEGNAFNQTIFGSSGNDSLVGGGGTDSLIGGLGNDTFTVDSLDDRTIEGTGGGTDTVLFTGTTGGYALNAGQEIEVLRAAPYAGVDGTGAPLDLADRAPGTDAIYLVGNGIAQLITGNNGANTILGSAAVNGDAGVNDTLAGLSGDDVYRVFTRGDVVLEGDDGGNDIIFTNTNFSLLENAVNATTFAGTLPGVTVATPLADGPDNGNGNIETLSAADQASVTGLTLLGDNGANRIIGNNGTNVLGGGLGNDVLIGLGRGDQFYFNETGAANVDTIQDFNAVNGGDRLLLNTTTFAGLGAAGATVTDAQFFNTSGGDTLSAAGTAQIVYDQVTGRLFYDANGGSIADAVEFARVAAGTDLIASDILLTGAAPAL